MCLFFHTFSVLLQRCLGNGSSDASRTERFHKFDASSPGSRCRISVKALTVGWLFTPSSFQPDDSGHGVRNVTREGIPWAHVDPSKVFG